MGFEMEDSPGKIDNDPLRSKRTPSNIGTLVASSDVKMAMLDATSFQDPFRSTEIQGMTWDMPLKLRCSPWKIGLKSPQKEIFINC